MWIWVLCIIWLSGANGFTKTQFAERGIPVGSPFEFLGPGPAASTHELLLVQSVWRHGERGPQNTFPRDLYPESVWPNGYGELTKTGFRQQIELGKWIRRRYVDKLRLLPSEYDPKMIRIQSTDYNRTIQSAMANVQGMYASADDIFIPAPVHSVPIDKDPVGLSMNGACRRANLIEIAFYSSPEAKEFENEHKILYEEIADALGIDRTWSVPHITDYFDGVFVEKARGLQLNDDIDHLYYRMLSASQEWDRIRFGIGVPTPLGLEMRKARGGPALTEIINRMKAKVECLKDNICDWELRYHAYSAHDSTIMGIFAVLGFNHTNVDRDENIQLASSLYFELWRDPSNSNYYVKVIFRRNADELMDLSIEISGCMSTVNGCTLDEFVERSQPYLTTPTTADYCSSPLEENLISK